MIYLEGNDKLHSCIWAMCYFVSREPCLISQMSDTLKWICLVPARMSLDMRLYDVYSHQPPPLPHKKTTPRVAAMLALQEVIMFTETAPPSPPQPPKVVRKDQPTPPKPSLTDPVTPKTMELLWDNQGDQARWFVQ